jgi:hypothetical protein
LTFIFNRNFILKPIFFKKAPVQVCFSNGWLSGEIFSAEKFAPEVLFVDRETPGFSLEDPGVCPYPRFSYS